MTPHSTGCNALHLLRNGPILRGPDWRRSPKLQISIFYNAIKAMEVFSGGVNVARVFAFQAAKSRRTMTPQSTGCNALNMLRNGPILRGHDWTRNPKLQLSIFYNTVKAMEVFSGGVNVARVFASCSRGFANAPSGGHISKPFGKITERSELDLMTESALPVSLEVSCSSGARQTKTAAQ